MAPKDQLGCSINGCKRPHLARGYCKSHYYSEWYYKQPVNPCSENGCETRVLSGGLCSTHYSQDYEKNRRRGREPKQCARDGCTEVVVSRSLLCKKHCHENVCSEDDCERPVLGLGLCVKHYSKDKYHDNPEPIRAAARERYHKGQRTNPRCSVRERGKRCPNRSFQDGLCPKHYHRQRRHGDPLVIKNRLAADDPGHRVGDARHPHYHRWYNIMERCYKPGDKDYPRYGGRGITVHPKWHTFSAFRDYLDTVLGERPEGYSLDRIDTDGNYEPGNVRWASATEQANNRRKHVKVGNTWSDPDSFYGCSVCDQTFKSINAFDRHQCELGDMC